MMRATITLLLTVLVQQEPTSRPAGPGVVDPLVERLRQDAAGTVDLEQRIVGLMRTVEENLQTAFDTGQRTQEPQLEILRQLDAAIELARQNLRKSKSSSSSDQPEQQGEKRQAGEIQEQTAAAGEQQRATGDAQQPDRPSGGVSNTPPDSELQQHRRGWGNLPQRDREAVIQGYRERSLTEYEELIEAYYRALSEEAAK